MGNNKEEGAKDQMIKAQESPEIIPQWHDDSGKGRSNMSMRHSRLPSLRRSGKDSRGGQE